jgi:hypothetical protein
MSGLDRKEAVLFLKKENQKDFFNPPPGALARIAPHRREVEQKFFAAFFFKKTATFLISISA